MFLKHEKNCHFAVHIITHQECLTYLNMITSFNNINTIVKKNKYITVVVVHNVTLETYLDFRSECVKCSKLTFTDETLTETQK